MPRILLLNADYGHAIGTAFRGKIEVDDLRILFLNKGNEHFIQCHAKHRGLVGWTSRIGAVVDRVLAMGHLFHREDGEAFDLIVIASVVAVGTFVGHLAWFEDAL